MDYLCLTHTSDMSAHKIHTYTDFLIFCLSLTHRLILSRSHGFFPSLTHSACQPRADLMKCVELRCPLWDLIGSLVSCRCLWWSVVGRAVGCVYSGWQQQEALCSRPQLLTCWPASEPAFCEKRKRDQWKCKRTRKQKVITLCGFKLWQFLVSVVLVYFTHIITQLFPLSD